MEIYLDLFENAIQKQAKIIGDETAYQIARKAGLGVSADGKIVSCVGEPPVVLLRLIKQMATCGNIKALSELTSLIDEIVEEDNLKV